MARSMGRADGNGSEGLKAMRRTGHIYWAFRAGFAIVGGIPISRLWRAVSAGL